MDSENEYIDDWVDVDELNDRQNKVIETIITLVLGYYLRMRGLIN